jgi:hypothetical protein
VIDRFFDPIIPAAAKIRAEDRYMPSDYMKNYESEDSGFDFTAASEIERTSWSNTALLTGEDELIPEAELPEAPEIPGQLSTEGYFEEHTVQADGASPASPHDSGEKSGKDDIVRLGVKSALDGTFAKFCRERSLHEGDLADRINNVFIDVLGDIILEDRGAGYELIEDYREDTENWLL